MLRLTLIAGLTAALAGCSSPDLGGTNFSCQTDADCSGGKVCATVNGAAACVVPSTAVIRIGMSAPLQGPSEGLGIEMRRGINALFERVNDDGGVFGREVTLDAMNDNYDPMTAVANTKQLLDIREEVPELDQPDVRGPNSVLALLGNVGTPPMLAVAPIATKNRTVFFAPFTGAQKYLRDGTNSPYVYNYRAGYYQETDAMVDYLATFRTPRIINAADAYKRIIAFTQNDSYGDAGYIGFVNSYNTRIAAVPQPDSALPNPSIARITYERENVASVDPAVAKAQQLLTDIQSQASVRSSVAIVMVDTYQPGNKFTRAIKDWVNQDATRAGMLDILFMHVSFVGSDALAKALISPPETYDDLFTSTKKTYAEGVIVTQVVPYYLSQSPGVTDYRADLLKFDGGDFTFTSLEGYVAAKLFIEALKLNGPTIDSQSLITTLDTKIDQLDIGIGTLLTFSSTNHQASHTVWGSQIQKDGTFTIPFSWNPSQKIIPGSN